MYVCMILCLEMFFCFLCTFTHLDVHSFAVSSEFYGHCSIVLKDCLDHHGSQGPWGMTSLICSSKCLRSSLSLTFICLCTDGLESISFSYISDSFQSQKIQLCFSISGYISIFLFLIISPLFIFYAISIIFCRWGQFFSFNNYSEI